MLHALARSASAREVWWLYGATDRSNHPFAQESRDALKGVPRSHSHIAYSKPGSDDQLGSDYDSSGRLTIAVLDRLGVPRDADYYLCGPQAFLEYFTTGLRGRGTPPAQIHSEIFGALEAVTPGIKPISQPRAHVPGGTPGDGPQVSFARSGITAPWNASFGSLLEFAEACDVPVRWSCRTGVCRTCESGLIGGTVAYQPQPLEPPAEGSILICCARPLGDVDIDL
jgi:ferredoxin